VDESPHRVKIELLIRQLEEEVRLLSSTHDQEMKQLKEASELQLFQLSNQFDDRIKQVNEQHQSKISYLEEEINYLMELNSSQRIMMENSAGHIQKLEQKLNSSGTDDQ
jgi:hypothetical protein